MQSAFVFVVFIILYIYMSVCVYISQHVRPFHRTPNLHQLFILMACCACVQMYMYVDMYMCNVRPRIQISAYIFCSCNNDIVFYTQHCSVVFVLAALPRLLNTLLVIAVVVVLVVAACRPVGRLSCE